MQEQNNQNKELWLLRSVRADWEQSFSVLQTGFDLLQRRLPENGADDTAELLDGMQDTLLRMEQMTGCLAELAECRMEQRTAEANPMDGADRLRQFEEAFRKLSFLREWPLCIELVLPTEPVCLLGNAVYLDMLLSSLIAGMLQLGGLEQTIRLELSGEGSIRLCSGAVRIPDAMRQAWQEENYGNLLQNRALYSLCMARLYSSAMQWTLQLPEQGVLEIKALLHDRAAPLQMRSPLAARLEQERVERVLDRELNGIFGRA